MNAGRTMPRVDRLASESTASFLSAGWRVSHTPKGRPNPCFFFVMISSGRKPRSASLKNQRSLSPFSL